MTGTPAGSADDDGPSLAERVGAGGRRFRARWRRLGKALGRAARRSMPGRVAGALGRSVERSRLVRWLTREPDPDVIVIDLAETRTIGPILGALDRVVGGLARPFETSSVRGASERTVDAVERNAVPAAGGLLLGYVLATLALTYRRAEPLWLAALAIAGGAGVLALAVDRSDVALAGSTVRDHLAAAIAPPDGDEPRARSGRDRTR